MQKPRMKKGDTSLVGTQTISNTQNYTFTRKQTAQRPYLHGMSACDSFNLFVNFQ